MIIRAKRKNIVLKLLFFMELPSLGALDSRMLYPKITADTNKVIFIYMYSEIVFN